jgi:hypothetical protein
MGGMVRWPMVSCLARETNDGASFSSSIGRATRSLHGEPIPRAGAAFIVMLQAPPGESFVFAPGQSMVAHDQIPNGSTRATSYQVALKPGQEQSLVFWMANRNERLNLYNVELSYSMP